MAKETEDTKQQQQQQQNASIALLSKCDFRHNTSTKHKIQ